ncbi:MAG: hypothetical protein WCP79_12925 [Bacillota bacterium]
MAAGSWRLVTTSQLPVTSDQQPTASKQPPAASGNNNRRNDEFNHKV